jgi:hypothetical protein
MSLSQEELFRLARGTNRKVSSIRKVNKDRKDLTVHTSLENFNLLPSMFSTRKDYGKTPINPLAKKTYGSLLGRWRTTFNDASLQDQFCWLQKLGGKTSKYPIYNDGYNGISIRIQAGSDLTIDIVHPTNLVGKSWTKAKTWSTTLMKLIKDFVRKHYYKFGFYSKFNLFLIRHNFIIDERE